MQVLFGHGFVHLHLQKPGWWAVVEAFPGVPIFFVISGFLISRSYERSPSLQAYARNRILRIYPALWVCIALTIVAASAAGFGFLHAQGAAWLPAQLVGVIYTPAFLSGFGFGSYNGSLWTIPLELQFYLVLPVCYALLPTTQRGFDVGIGVMLIAFTGVALAFALNASPFGQGQAEPLAQKVFRYTFAPHFYLFVAGVLLQRLRIEHAGYIAGKALVWVAAYLAFYFLTPRNGWTEIAGGLLMALCVVSVAYTMPGLARRVLRGNDVSYGVYIYHGLLINVFLTLGWQGHPMLMPLLIATTLAASAASWVFVERPFLRKKSAGPAAAGLKPA